MKLWRGAYRTLRRSAGSDVSPCPQPDRATLERPPLVLAHAAPDAGILTGVYGPPKAVLQHSATPAHLLGFFNLKERGAAVSDREEQLRIYLTTGGNVTPVHDVYLLLLGVAAGHRAVRHTPLGACEVFHELCDMSGTFVYSRSCGSARRSQYVSADARTLSGGRRTRVNHAHARRATPPQAPELASQQVTASARGHGKRVSRIWCQIGHNMRAM